MSRPLWLVFILLFSATSARASGPTERLKQLLIHPSQPDLLVLRYAAGTSSQGYLYSRDGGRSFQLLCSAAIPPPGADAQLVQRISTRAIPSTATALVDQTGAVMYAQYGATWVDDTTGCSWSDVPALRDTWPLGLKLDERDPSVIWSVVNTTPATGSTQPSKLELVRRSAETWTTVGSIRSIETDKYVMDASLAVFANADRRRLYTSVFITGLQSDSAGYVLRSDDDGATWTEYPLPKEQEELVLLAVDPTNPERVLAAISRDGSTDTLLLSVDGGATFTSYFEPRAVGGVTFDETGRVYLGDIGDGVLTDGEGGLFTAAHLGEPLTKVPNTGAVDCLVYQPQSKRLLVCSGDRFGIMDPATGALSELLRIDQVTDFVECPGKDLHAVCQDQLNSGPSWCCAGHYPDTPLCGEYNVTVRPDKGRVYCGLAGREYDRPGSGNMAGDAGTDAGPSADAGRRVDAAVPDAAVLDAAPRDEGQRQTSAEGCGCRTSSGSSVNASLAALAIMVGLLVRRRQRH